MAFVTGACERLVARGAPVGGCSAQLANVSYANGRFGIWFTKPDGSIVSFSGSRKGEVLQSVGTCSYDDPFKGPARIVCDAATEDGPFEGRFLTDGKPPQ